MEIKTKTEYTDKALKCFSRYQASHQVRLWVVFAIGTLLTYIGSILFLLLKSYIAPFFVVLAFFFTICDIVVPITIPKRMYKNSRTVNAVVNYTFLDDYFVAERKDEYLEDTASIKYASLFAVIKHKNYLYLYIEERKVYILDLLGISEKGSRGFEKIDNPKCEKGYLEIRGNYGNQNKNRIYS